MSKELTFHAALKQLGMTKAEFARHIGMKPGTVYRWTDENCPRYAMAYLELACDKQKTQSV